MKLKIELLSDLCTYSGETYNSMVDTDVVYDDYGFPYIQAKRLKGCIREAYLELVEFGLFSQESMEKIFGKEGNQRSAFSLSDAYLQDYELMKSDIEKEADTAAVHVQNVLRLYTYTRTQTAVDVNSGVAIKNSLRTMRVIKKGLVFETDLHINDILTEEEKMQLCQAIESVCHMGVSRSRGLGIVKVRVEEMENEADAKTEDHNISEKNKLMYSVRLLSPMLCKSAEGNQAKTLVYLEGSKILGLLAGAMGQQAFQELMAEQSFEKGNELIVSNAYISNGGKRCTPTRASLQKKKDQKFDADGRLEAADMLFVEKTSEQMTSVGHAFSDADGYVQGVDTEINYHHRRPSDKSIGRATGMDDSAFYQMESIRAGQVFQGFILADRAQAEKICETVKQMKNVRMGYGRNTQYGSVSFQIDEIQSVESVETPEVLHDFQIKLNAPVILYNENGMYAADMGTFENYLRKVFGTDDVTIVKPFLKYETIGGFNVTWNRRKQVFTALGMGTICQIHSEKGVHIAKNSTLFIGERVNEGFGEVEISQGNSPVYVLKKNDAKEQKCSEEAMQTDIVQKLFREATRKAVMEMARADAGKCVGAKSAKEIQEMNTALGRVIRIFKEQPTVEAMSEQIAGIEKESKSEQAKEMEKYIKAACEKAYTYGGRLDEKFQFTKDEIYAIYGDAYLKQMKYILRAARKE